MLEGNMSAAVRALEGDHYETADDRAYRIRKKIAEQRGSELVGDYIEKQFEQIGAEAIERVSEMVHSSDERIATKNAHFIIEHVRGKAVQRSVTLTGKLNIQSVLD